MSSEPSKLQAALTESIWQNLALTQENRKLLTINATLNRTCHELRAQLQEKAPPLRRDRT